MAYQRRVQSTSPQEYRYSLTDHLIRSSLGTVKFFALPANDVADELLFYLLFEGGTSCIEAPPEQAPAHAHRSFHWQSD